MSNEDLISILCPLDDYSKFSPYCDETIIKQLNKMPLPTEFSTTVRKNPRITILYGAPKVGKTALFDNNPANKAITVKLPDCLLIDCEKGSDFIIAKKVIVNDMMELKGIAAEIAEYKKKEGKYPYKVVVFDTIDKIQDWATAQATWFYKSTIMGKSFEGSSVLQLPNGSGYQYLWEQMHKFIDMAKGMAEHIILIGHIRDKNIVGAGVGAVSTFSADLDLQGKVRNIVCGEADTIGYVYRNKNSELCINFKTRDEVNCGSRCDHLKGVDMNPFTWDKFFIE